MWTRDCNILSFGGGQWLVTSWLGWLPTSTAYAWAEGAGDGSERRRLRVDFFRLKKIKFNLHNVCAKKMVRDVSLTAVWQSAEINGSHKGGEFHISHDASRLISSFSPRRKERSRVSREFFKDLNFKMQLIQGKFYVPCKFLVSNW